MLLNLWIIFRIGTHIKNERTGWYSVLLYTASIYGTVISGIFILPDTPQGFFWLLGLFLMVTTLPQGPDPKSTRRILLLGLVLGLGIISKYTTVFLWMGTGLFMFLFRRQWIKDWSVYVALMITFICTLPLLIWNVQNDFVSFTFHGERVGVTGYGINFNYFTREFVGELFYNNPINFVLILMALVKIAFWKLELKKAYQAILVLSALPLIMSFLIFSLFRETLPHWSALGYVSLTFLGAVCLEQKKPSVGRWVNGINIGLISLILILGYLQINKGIYHVEPVEQYHRLGKNDPTVDMFGYRQVGEAFTGIVARDKKSGAMPENAYLFGDNWFPLSNYEYYAARPAGITALGISDLDHLHKYAWINEERGGFKLGISGYYISDSRYYRIPQSRLSQYFDVTEAIDTIQIYRNKEVVKRAFVWRLKNMKRLPEDPFQCLLIKAARDACYRKCGRFLSACTNTILPVPFPLLPPCGG